MDELRTTYLQGRWLLITGEPHHICTSDKFFSSKLRLPTREESKYQNLQVEGIGSVSIFAEGVDGGCERIDLYNVRYVLNCKPKYQVHNIVVARGDFNISSLDGNTGKCMVEFEDDAGRQVTCLAWENGGIITLQMCTSDECRSSKTHLG